MTEDELLDEELPEDEADTAEDLFDTEVAVTCPHCGAPVSLALDPGGGREQEYVQDCEVCCRPWRVELHYDARGAADVLLEGLE